MRILTGGRSHPSDFDVRFLPGLPRLAPRAARPAKVLWHGLDQWRPGVHAAVGREIDLFPGSIVHTHEVQGLSAAVYTAIATRRVSHAHTAHDYNAFCARVTLTRGGSPCTRRCLGCRAQRAVRAPALARRLDALIAPSRYVAERHLEVIPELSDRTHVIEHGAMPGSSRLRASPHDDTPIRLAFIGSLSEHKGVATLLRALDESNQALELHIAGQGALERCVQEASSRDPRITYWGFVHGPMKDRFLDHADILVIPSEWEEPATLVASEAAVRGLPIVASDRGGLVDAPEARLFAAGSTKSLLGAIQWLLRKDHLETTSRRLLDRQHRFSWTHHVDRVETVLSEAGPHDSA